MGYETRCLTCRHWGEAKDEYRTDWHAEKIGFRKCTRVLPRWEIENQVPEDIRVGKWGDDTAEALYDKATIQVFSSHPAYVQDGSEYVAELMTGPSFGCVLHEPTETP